MRHMQEKFEIDSKIAGQFCAVILDRGSYPLRKNWFYQFFLPPLGA